MERYLIDSNIYELTNEVANICIEIRKVHKTKLPDAIIASTAIANNMVLITRNKKDFEKINELKIINPHSI